MTDRQRDIDAIRAKMLAEKERREMKEREQWWTYCRVPRRYWHITSATIPDKLPYKAQIQAWAEKFKAAHRKREPFPGLYLHGPMGTGKTAIAASLLRWSVDNYMLGVFMAWGEVTTLYKNNPLYVPNVDNERGVWDAAHDVPLVVIDDIGRNYRGTAYDDYALSLTENLLRHRYTTGLTTILTSNPDTQFMEKMPSMSSLALLIRECCYEVEVIGANYREVLADMKPPLIEDDK